MSLPDPEKVIGAYLRTKTGKSVITDPAPRSVADPWIRVTLLDDASTDGGIVDRALACYVQIDVFAGKSGTIATARDLAESVRENMRTAHLETHAGATVLGAQLSMSRSPDTSFEPAMERYIITGTVWVR